MSDQRKGDEEECYCIKVKGVLDEKWADWFGGLTIQSAEFFEETLLIGPVADQAALHGILAKIRDLGLTLISVQVLEGQEGGSDDCR